jgi:phage I-like protein
MFHDFDPYESLQELQKQVYILSQKVNSQELLIQQMVEAINSQANLLTSHTACINDLKAGSQ